VIKSFHSVDAERLFNRERVKKFQAIEHIALRNLKMLDATWRLRDLSAAAGSHLEPLKGDRKGQYSIRINDQWRSCFLWQERDAFGVEIVDYR
jgi:proteic killer suppression protein